MSIEKIKQILEEEKALELAILVGSRATGRTHAESDWDIAIQWQRDLPFMEMLGKTETLRRKLAQALDIGENKIDLIDLPRARLAMRAVVAEEGIPLKGENTLAWYHFLQRVWRELEEYHWHKTRFCQN